MAQCGVVAEGTGLRWVLQEMSLCYCSWSAELLLLSACPSFGQGFVWCHGSCRHSAVSYDHLRGWEAPRRAQMAKAAEKCCWCTGEPRELRWQLVLGTGHLEEESQRGGAVLRLPTLLGGEEALGHRSSPSPGSHQRCCSCTRAEGAGAVWHALPCPAGSHAAGGLVQGWVHPEGGVKVIRFGQGEGNVEFGSRECGLF